MIDLKKMIEDAWDNRTLLSENDYINAINTVIERLYKGEIRVA
jgi:2,3,4,5-tetrahydropyridine-2-carboxylate N-succinyltransferase